MNTTPGPWIVSTSTIKGSPDRRSHICVMQVANNNKMVAFTGFEGELDEAESIANAALIAIAPEMLDALIAIQEFANSRDGIDDEAVNVMISDIFAKLANEAGEL